MPDRREFLSSSAVLGLSLLAPRPARARGRVAARGKGIPGAVVSDGLSSTPTDANGDFELVSDRRARFAFVSLPSGYRIPKDEFGLARTYQRLQFDGRGEAAFECELEPAELGNDHRFLVFGDTQIANGDEADELDRAMKDVDRNVLFGVTCGDLVHDAMELFPRYRSAVASLGVPFFQVVGNHDLDPARGSVRGTTTFESYFGPAHYSFNAGGVHYVVLNDVFWLGDGYVGFLDEDQLSWLASDLARVEAGSAVVVFAHIPFLSTASERTGGKIAKREGEVTNRSRGVRSSRSRRSDSPKPGMDHGHRPPGSPPPGAFRAPAGWRHSCEHRSLLDGDRSRCPARDLSRRRPGRQRSRAVQSSIGEDDISPGSG